MMKQDKKFNYTPLNFIQSSLIEKNNAHYYETPSGKIYPSITTMLGKTQPPEKKQSLSNWRKNEVAADYIIRTSAMIGTETHKLIEDYLHGIEQTKSMLLSHAHFNNLLPFVNKIDNIHGIEIRLYSDEMKLAGTSDCIAEYDGKLSIIDYKTKRSNQREEWLTDHFIQGTAYSRMYEERTGVKIDQVVILVSSEKNTRMEFVKDVKDYSEMLDDRLLRFNMAQVVN